ncbi:hypothetical protein AADX85_15430, partial [Staphylococcus epidermidis]
SSGVALALHITTQSTSVVANTSTHQNLANQLRQQVSQATSCLHSQFASFNQKHVFKKSHILGCSSFFVVKLSSKYIYFPY